MRAHALTLAALLLAISTAAGAQDGALSLTRPVGKPVEVPPAPTRVDGGALSLVAPGGKQPQARTTMVDTSRGQSAPVTAGLTADTREASYAMPPAVAPAYGTDPSDQLVAQQAMIGGGRPGELTIRPGKTELVQVSRTHLNRFVTPFANPEVQSSAQATTTKVEGPVVYVATASPDPVGLFIVDGDNPANAFSVTLMPREIPAVSMTLALEGYAPGAAPARAGESAAVENDFVAQLRETFRSIAQGEVPAGYGMRRVAGFDPNMPECVMPGLRATPAQEISGNQVIVIVSKLTNHTNLPQMIDESSCASDRVLAVAVWPRVDLLPGQSTELYIAVRRAPPPAANARPSVL